jgi:Ca2+-binding RTX toxin-like protein
MGDVPVMFSGRSHLLDMRSKLAKLLLPLLGAMLLTSGAIAAAQTAVLDGGQADAVCGQEHSQETCGPGNGRKTEGGGEKVSHKGWPAIGGILWQVQGSHNGSMTGSTVDDELLGHDGSDTVNGSDGNDVIWGDWDPKHNSAKQKDTLTGGLGNDFIYPSHGRTKVDAGDGNDYVWAFYGKGTIDCGPGEDRVRVRLNKAFKLKNCETVTHFCQFGSNGKGGCLKPGEKKSAKKP